MPKLCLKPPERRSLFFARLLLAGFLMQLTLQAEAGGGVILRDDVCIITIGFYEAHFTAYQPDTSGNTEFCEDLPDTGESIFVLDYLHSSLKEVPVDFRIIKNTTELGQFVRWEDLQQLEDIESLTVYYRPPSIEANGSYRVQHEFPDKGDYIGIVTAGHPSNDKTYSAVFPFRVGASRYPYWLVYLIATGLLVLLIRYAYVSMSNGAESG